MTYAEFLALFLALPLLALAAILRRRLLNRRYLAITALLLVIALAYMAPWDHTAAVWQLWIWAPGRTWGARIWNVPPEEYLFCLLEALLAITITFAALSAWGTPSTQPTQLAEGSPAAEAEGATQP
ncbi:MAG TPA: lycopene cyclase domain-containing protein [Ktedonobacterales bacterium]|nr:lycopene cyclase domain-containing protein [Ktedonobacterales bacterium]